MKVWEQFSGEVQKNRMDIIAYLTTSHGILKFSLKLMFEHSKL